MQHPDRESVGDIAADLVDVVYVIRLEPDMAFEFVSDSVESLVGYTPQEHYDDPGLGMRILDPRDLPELQKAADVPLGHTYDFTVRWVAKDGRTIWTHHRCRRARRPDGSIVLTGAAQDVTAAKEREEEASRLQRSEVLLHVSMNQSAVATCLCRIDGRFLEVNDAMCELFGYSREQLSARTWRDLTHPDDLAASELASQRLAAGTPGHDSQAYRVTKRYLHADGHVIYGDLNAGPVDMEGEERLLLGQIIDVSDSVLARQQLAHSEERFRRSMAESAVPICIIEPDGSFGEVNQAVCDFFGFTEEQLRGKTWQELTHPDDLDIDLGQVRRVQRGELDHYRLTKRYLDATGRVRYGDLSVTGIRDQDGSLSYFVSQIVDITEQTESRQALARSEESFRLLANNQSDLVLRQSAAGVIEWASPSALTLGWSGSDLVGRSFTDLVHPDDLEKAFAVSERLAQGIATNEDLRVRTGSDDYRWMAGAFSPITTSDDEASGEASGQVVTLRDIEDLVHARALAARREREFELLAENAADIVSRVGADGRIEWISRAVTSLLGWDSEDLVGSSPAQFMHPDDIPRFRERLADTPDGGRGAVSLRMRDQLGRFLWFSIVDTAITDDLGRPAGRIMGMRNIDREIATMERLARSEEMFRLAMSSAPSGMALVALDRTFREVNDALTFMVGRDRDWLLHHSVRDILTPEDDEVDLQLRDEVLAGGSPVGVQEKRLRHADGHLLWVQHSVSLLRDDAGQPILYVSQFVDITAAKQQQQELEFVARHDALTELPNRRALEDEMRRQLRAPGGHGLGVLFCDLDDLKTINDSYGHSVGDRVLALVARRIADSLRHTDLVARIGGDEFVVLLADTSDDSTIRQVGDQIRRAVSIPISGPEPTITPRISLGGTTAHAGESPAVVLERADRALYRAKRGGRDQTVVFDSTRDASSPHSSAVSD